MNFNAEQLYELLPATYRVRDAKAGEPLRSLIAVIAEQVAVLEEDLAQLYDDQFIETCAEWSVPYIGDLVGTRGLSSFPGASFSGRAQVANTIAYRRRKGTATVLEQLARDVTGWNASVVEYFQRLATTQYMNHVRPENLSFTSLRDQVTITYPRSAGTHETDRRSETVQNWERLELVTTPFDRSARTADVRHIDIGRGKHNIPNIGVFLWRLENYQISESPARRIDARRFCFDPLGRDIPLFNKPETEGKITHLAEPINVPMPISRRELHERLNLYYGPQRSINAVVTYAHGSVPPVEETVDSCNLSDVVDSDGNVAGWAHMPTDKIAIDPVLGRIALPADADKVEVNYYYGFSAKMGGGEYGRTTSFSNLDQVVRVPSDTPSIQAAINALPPTGGVVEIENSGHYFETPELDLQESSKIEIRGADGQRPVIFTSGDIQISGGEHAEASLNGLLIAGGNVVVSAKTPSGIDSQLRSLKIEHCTLAPDHEPVEGVSSLPAESPPSPIEVRLLVELEGADVEIGHSILGPIRAIDGGSVRIENSIVDAGSPTAPAYAGAGVAPGAALTVINSTVIGRVHTSVLMLASNTIFFAESGSDAPAVCATRRQEGCVRFSYVPEESQAPRKYECHPAPGESKLGLTPVFTSLRFGDPGYGQLHGLTASEIRRGADDESEMGAFHDLFQPQREANLKERLQEYLRFGLEAGIFLTT